MSKKAYFLPLTTSADTFCRLQAIVLAAIGGALSEIAASTCSHRSTSTVSP